MREILYRGRCVDAREKTGEWIFGYYIFAKSVWASVHAIVTPSRDPDGGIRTLEIDPDTLGEFTGRKDKTGQRIFEGDVVEWIGNPKQRYRVVYGADASFFGTPINEKGGLEAGASLGMLNAEDGLAVIGNIHDAILGVGVQL